MSSFLLNSGLRLCVVCFFNLEVNLDAILVICWRQKLFKRVDLISHPEAHIVDANQIIGRLSVAVQGVFQPGGQVAWVRKEGLEDEQERHRAEVDEQYSDDAGLQA